MRETHSFISMRALTVITHKRLKLSLSLCSLLAIGCSSEVKVAIVDKPIEQPTTLAPAESPQPASADLAKGAADLVWTIPSSWEMVPPPRMVLARFVASEGAMLSISNFSGGGSDLANLTRWAGQLGVALNPDQIDTLKRPVNNASVRLTRYYLASEAKAFDVAVTRLHGTAWFFKFEGTPEALSNERANFEAFLESIIHDHHHEHTQVSAPSPKPAATPAPAPQPPANPNASGTMTPLPGMEAQVAQIAGAQWKAPATWTEGPAKSMRKGTYYLQGAGGQAELSITAFPGDVGGLAANINRWRGQIGLPSLDEASLLEQSITKDVAGLSSRIVWLQGDTSAILGAIVPRAQETWFFKATGPATTLEEHRQAFAAFLDTVTF